VIEKKKEKRQRNRKGWSDKEIHLPKIFDGDDEFLSGIRKITGNYGKYKEGKEEVQIWVEWEQEIIPNWHRLYGSTKLQNMWRRGIPPGLRSTVWPLGVQNKLKITKSTFQALVEKLKQVQRRYLRNGDADNMKEIPSLEGDQKHIEQTDYQEVNNNCKETTTEAKGKQTQYTNVQKKHNIKQGNTDHQTKEKTEKKGVEKEQEEQHREKGKEIQEKEKDGGKEKETKRRNSEKETQMLVWELAYPLGRKEQRSLTRIITGHQKREYTYHKNTLREEEDRNYINNKALIEQDVPRTFPGVSLFNELSPIHQQLKFLLEAYALFCPEIGYVQGMSHIGGMLLLYLEEFSAFVILANLLNSHFFKSLYKLDIPEILKHIRIYDLMFSANLPWLFDTFKNLNITAEHYLLDWLFTMFSRCIPFSLLGRLWDCLLLEGEIFLFQCALAILRILSPQLKRSSFEEILQCFRHPPQDLIGLRLFSVLETIQVPSYCKKFLDRIETHAVGNSV